MRSGNLLYPKKTRGDYFRIIQNQAVPGYKKIYNIIKMPVEDLTADPVHDKQSGIRTLLQGILGNKIFRKFKYKILCFH